MSINKPNKLSDKKIMINNATQYKMWDILEYLGTSDTRDAKLFGKLTILHEVGQYYDTLVVNDKR